MTSDNEVPEVYDTSISDIWNSNYTNQSLIILAKTIHQVWNKYGNNETDAYLVMVEIERQAPAIFRITLVQRFIEAGYTLAHIRMEVPEPAIPSTD